MSSDRYRMIHDPMATPTTATAQQIALDNPGKGWKPLLGALFDAGRVVTPDIAAAYAGLKSGPGGGSQVLGRSVDGEGELYDVGLAKDLRNSSIPYTQVHHVGQSAQAETLIGDFNPVDQVGNEPAIRISESEHVAINAAQGAYATPVSARGLLARDISLLRNKTDAPNSALQALIDLNVKTHPSDYAPLQRSNP